MAAKIPADLHGCHPIVSAPRKSLQAEKDPNGGLLSASVPGTLHVTVSKIQMRRALLLMEGLIRACEKQGWLVDASGQEPRTAFSIDGVVVSSELRERLVRTKEQKTVIGPYSWARENLSPSGRLALTITSRDYWGKTRYFWVDGRKWQLEDLLPEIAMTMSLHAAGIKRHEMDEAEEERREEEGRRQREFREKLAQRERDRRAALIRCSESWHEAKSIREFLAEVERRKEGQAVAREPEFEKWLVWARRVADRSDPFQNGALTRMVAGHSSSRIRAHRIKRPSRRSDSESFRE